jgi:hypothetical protein
LRRKADQSELIGLFHAIILPIWFVLPIGDHWLYHSFADLEISQMPVDYRLWILDMKILPIFWGR